MGMGSGDAQWDGQWGRAGGSDSGMGRGDGQWGWAAAMGSKGELSAPRQSGAPCSAGYVPVTPNSPLCNSSWPPRFFPGAVQGASSQLGLQLWVLVEGGREFAAAFSRCNGANVNSSGVLSEKWRFLP